METKESRINREMGLQLKREQAVSPRSVKWLAERTGISEATINRMWSKDPRDINITQITWLSALMGVDPVELVRQALEKAGGMGAVMAEVEAMSADAAKQDDLSARRAQKEAEQMSVAEIEKDANAAITDPALDAPEPEAP